MFDSAKSVKSSCPVAPQYIFTQRCDQSGIAFGAELIPLSFSNYVLVIARPLQLHSCAEIWTFLNHVKLSHKFIVRTGFHLGAPQRSSKSRECASQKYQSQDIINFNCVQPDD